MEEEVLDIIGNKQLIDQIGRLFNKIEAFLAKKVEKGLCYSINFYMYSGENRDNVYTYIAGRGIQPHRFAEGMKVFITTAYKHMGENDAQRAAYFLQFKADIIDYIDKLLEKYKPDFM